MENFNRDLNNVSKLSKMQMHANKEAWSTSLLRKSPLYLLSTEQYIILRLSKYCSPYFQMPLIHWFYNDLHS